MKPSTQRVLTALQHAGRHGLTTGELNKIGGTRFGARILELRRMGYIITCKRMRDGCSRYWIDSQPVPVVERQEPPAPVITTQDGLFALPPVRHYDTWSDAA